MRLAPSSWIHQTEIHSIKIKRQFLPFWNIKIQGSIECVIHTRFKIPTRHGEQYFTHKQWHSFPVRIDNVSFDSINICASEIYDKYYLHSLDISFDEISISDLNLKEQELEEVTLEKNSAFDHAWILIIQPLLSEKCLQEARKIYPNFDDIQINTIHFDIESKQERLFYYPIYIINYFYKKHDQFICLVDGVTGCIVGDRQYSMVKVTTATFVTFYPLLKIALFSFGSVANFLLGFEIAAEITFLSILPLAFVISPCIGLFASSYSKKYRKTLIKDQWERDQANASKSTHTYHMIDQDSIPKTINEKSR